MPAPARTRSAQGGRRSRSRRAKKEPRLSRAEMAGIAILVAATGSVPFLIDLSSLLAELRDAVARTFGLGLIIVVVLAAAAGFALARGAGTRGIPARSATLFLLGAYVAWGALGMNHASWSLGSVEFSEVSLGGRIGRSLVSTWAGGVAFVGVLVAFAWVASPSFVTRTATWIPRIARYPFARRYPQRMLDALERATTWLHSLRRTGSDSEDIIGLERAGPEPRPVGTFETEPVRIRPSVDAGGPASIVGAGAAVAVRAHGETPDETSVTTPPSEGEHQDEDENAPASTVVDAGAPEVTPIPGRWHLPAIELLNAPIPSAVRKHDNAARAQLIVDTLASFGVDATVVEINEGPTVTQFGVEPGWEIRYKDVRERGPDGKPMLGPDGRPLTRKEETGRTRVRVNKITVLQNDLALALAAPSLRIEAPVPGRAIVGIEVPNDSASVVTLRAVMESKEFQSLAVRAKLAIALGMGVSGVPVVADLARMPHLLIAGATGSGKSVCMNSIIAGLMMNATPDEVRFIMIDPKRVELTPFGQIPHLAFSEVVVDIDKVVGVLQAMVSEMESRYKKFSSMAVRNIEAYNRHPRVVKKLPYWVVIIDELADLMMAAPFEVEKLLCRLAQLARATGIHLVVATQRPSVDVITGLIKANFPTRIAFATTSQTDSRTILDMGGAEKLLGRGDMLFMPTDASKPKRIQGVYVSDTEVERLVEFWTDDRFRDLAPETADDLLAEALEAGAGEGARGLDPDDPIMEEARELASMHERISPSMIERRLGVGHSKACAIVEELADEGIVGPREEGQSRRVLAASQSDADW